MSFILDALKKSETDRQQKGSAEFAGVPTSAPRESAPRWLWILGLLLAINLAVLIYLLTRPELNPESTAGTVQSAQPIVVAPEKTESIPSTETSDAFADQVAAAKQNAPRREAPRPVVTEASGTAPPLANTPPPRTTSSSLALPTIHEVQAGGMISLPELRVDVHVYSEIPEDRFVFINMNKHKEGSRMMEGPVVREIRSDGVVLEQNGVSFLLPRD